MRRRNAQMLITATAVALIVATLTYWMGSTDAPPATKLENVKATASHPEVRPISPTKQLDEGAPVTLIVDAPMVEAPRPDAGFYEHPSRSYGVSGLLFFINILAVSEQDMQEAIDKVIAVTQVSNETAREFVEYIKKAKKDLDQYESEVGGRMCAQRGAIQTIQHLAAAFDEVDTAVESRRAQITRGSEEVLGDVGMRNFEMYIANRDRGKRVNSRDNEATLTALNKHPADVLDIYCNKR